VASSSPPGTLPILILYSQVDAVVKGEQADVLADWETVEAAVDIRRALEAAGHRVRYAAVTCDVRAALAPYSPREWLVFNLCESVGGDSTLEATVPPILEELGFAYTGASGEAMALCQHKARAKALFERHGLTTPRYAVLDSPDQPCTVPLPAIVKPVAEDASLGLSEDSVVRDAAGVARQVAYILERYRQPALVEEFIAGREFEVPVWGNDPPQAMPIIEIRYVGIEDPLRRFLTYEGKWVEDSFTYNHTQLVCPAPIEPGLQARLEAEALAAYRLTGCRDYARLDVRERAGVPYILEVNPNPSIYSFTPVLQAAGFGRPQLVDCIVRFAMERRSGHMGRRPCAGADRQAGNAASPLLAPLPREE